MTRLEDLLDDEFRTPDAELALELAREDQHLLEELIRLRDQRGMSQQDVADLLGLSQATISAFERAGNDPHLSTVRRYARALGVMIRHHIDPDGLCDGRSHYIAHVSDGGVKSVDTASALARVLQAGSATRWPQRQSVSENIKRQEQMA